MINKMGLIIFYIGCYGLTTLIVQSKIFKPLRDYFSNGFFHNLLNCMMCTSFWVGLFSVIFLKFSPSLTYIISEPNIDDISPFQIIYSILFDSFSVVGFVWFVYLIQCLIEDNLKREL